jgi:hypothetical protein
MGLIIGITHILTGFLIFMISIPMYRGQVAPNRFYGIRFRKSYASDAHWYAINQYGGRQFMIWSAVLMLVGGTTLFVPLDHDRTRMLALAIAPTFLLLVPALLTYRFARHFQPPPETSG